MYTIKIIINSCDWFDNHLTCMLTFFWHIFDIKWHVKMLSITRWYYPPPPYPECMSPRFDRVLTSQLSPFSIPLNFLKYLAFRKNAPKYFWDYRYILIWAKGNIRYIQLTAHTTGAHCVRQRFTGHARAIQVMHIVLTRPPQPERLNPVSSINSKYAIGKA